MSLSMTQPGSPSSNGAVSPASAPSPAPPLTPDAGLQPMTLPEVSMPSIVAAANSAQAQQAAKRKPSRRANTAERRATHNAVERQRRETLNSRFLDLAALLPNLQQIRRPSKSAIVNSSIAHVHASRRHRLMAARELRLAKLEADALRRELNQWRDRAGLPQVEEPIRSEAFGLVLSGDLELEAELAEHGAHGQFGMSMIDEEDGYDGQFDEDGEDYGHMQAQPHPAPVNMNMMGMANMVASPTGLVEEDPLAHAQAVAMLKQQSPFAHNLPAQHPQLAIRTTSAQHIAPSPLSAHPHSAHSFAASPTAIHFDGTPSIQYESHRLLPPGHPAHFQEVAQTHYVGNGMGAMPADKMAQWSHYNGNVYSPSQQQQQNNYAMMMQQQLMKQGHVFGSPIDGDDVSVSSAPGSAHGVRPRTNSNASLSASFASSPRGTGSVSGSYELPSEFNVAMNAARSRNVSSNGTSPIQIPVGAGLTVGTAFGMML